MITEAEVEQAKKVKEEFENFSIAVKKFKESQKPTAQKEGVVNGENVIVFIKDNSIGLRFENNEKSLKFYNSL